MRTIIACLMLSCAAFAGAPPSEPYTREVKVPEAGWYRVPVDGHIWRYARGRVLAFDEQGKALPCGILAVETPSPASEEAQPRLEKVEEEGGKLVLYLQVDKLAGKHDRLIFDFGGVDILNELELWGSTDGKDWKSMAKGTLFRLGTSERMQGSALDYPTCAFDRLKLALPLLGELKQTVRDFRVGNIRLHYSPKCVESPWIEESVAVHKADPELAQALVGRDEELLILDLPVGRYPAQQIRLPIETPHLPFTVSTLKMVLSPEWVYSCALETDVQAFPVLKGRLVSATYIKLPKEKADITTIFVSRPKEEVIFFGDYAGIVTLAYGGFEKRPSPFPEVKRPDISKEIVLGPIAERPIFVSPEITAMARKLSLPTKLIAVWNIKLPKGVKPGQWVMVEIGPAIWNSVYSAPDCAWGIISDGKALPFTWQFDPDPMLLKKQTLELKAVENLTIGGLAATGTLKFDQHLLLPSWISIKMGRFPEPVSIHVEAQKSFVRKGERWSSNPPDTWSNLGWVSLDGGPWAEESIAVLDTLSDLFKYHGLLRLTARADHTNPPDSIQVTAWWDRNYIAFPAPETASAQLVFGSTDHRTYLSKQDHFISSLIFNEFPQARIVGPVPLTGRAGYWDRIIFIAGLILAVAVLLYLIVKLLPKKEAA